MIRSELLLDGEPLFDGPPGPGIALVPRAVHALEFNDGVRREGNKHLLEWTIVAGYLEELFRAARSALEEGTA